MFALRRSRRFISIERVSSSLARQIFSRSGVSQNIVRHYAAQDTGKSKSDSRRPILHYGSENAPSRTLFIHGIGRRVTGGHQEEIIELFKAFANITDVRMAEYYCFVEAETVEQAAALMEEHKKNPFHYGDKVLYLDYEPNTVTQKIRPILRIAGLTGGEQLLRKKVLLGWEDKVRNTRVVKSKLRDDEVAFVTFHNLDDALAARKMCSTLFPHLEATLWDGREHSKAKEFAEPSDTLCIVGYDGSLEDFRRYFHNFRLDITDVRRPPQHAEKGRWDFVFVRFRATQKAIAAMNHLKQFDQFRVRYATHKTEKFSIAETDQGSEKLDRPL